MEIHTDVGNPAEVIVRVADEVGADLIVVGSKGMRGNPADPGLGPQQRGPQGRLPRAGRQDHLIACRTPRTRRPGPGGVDVPPPAGDTGYLMETRFDARGKVIIID